MKTRLVLAIISTLLQEGAIVVIWRWGLPQFGIELSLSVLIGVMIAWGAYAAVTFWIVTRTLQREVVIGLPTMVGGRGKVISSLAPEGQVRIKGEIWEARAIETRIESGEEITVIGQDGLKLIVRKANKK